MVIGIDEVGRGAWAGPLVVGAVGLDGFEIEGLTDSKLLSKKRREALSLIIKKNAPKIGIGWVSARDIDTIGISAALKLAARRAISQMDVADDDQIIIDGTISLLQGPSLQTTTMKKADLLVPSVSAASVIAKVARDHYMYLCDEVFPGYKWDGNVGYGASAHQQGIDELGVTPLHRMSFAPMKHMNDSNNYHMQNNAVVQKNTTSVGNRAEDEACRYLIDNGYEIIDRNWKTKWCEVDIIARKREVIHFVEVKYRKYDDQGGGIAAITPKKLNQMNFAAKLWLHINGEHDATLSVIELSGKDYSVGQFIERA